jgi:hypothetical protein
MDSGGENKRQSLRTGSGLEVSLHEEGGIETLTLGTPQGHKLTIHGGPPSVTVSDANGNSILLGPGGIQITSSSKVTINASEVAINAENLEINSASTKITGAITADAIIANTVTATVYSPGSGNVW